MEVALFRPLALAGRAPRGQWVSLPRPTCGDFTLACEIVHGGVFTPQKSSNTESGCWVFFFSFRELFPRAELGLWKPLGYLYCLC